MQLQLISLQVGMPQSLRIDGQTVQTGFQKTPQTGVIRVHTTGLVGDEQGDTRHHGGPDKAVCVYLQQNYAYWEQQLNQPLAYGAFGENFTLQGGLESDVCIGDVFSVDTLGQSSDARFQVTQPRQPCWKLAHYMGQPDFVREVQTSNRTGFYFRVLHTGTIHSGVTLSRTWSDETRVSIQYANDVMYRERDGSAGLMRVLSVPALSESWRLTLTERLTKVGT